MGDILDVPQNQEDDPLVYNQIRTSNFLKNGVSNLYRQIISAYDRMYTWVWENPLGLTPQQVADSLGTRAASLFMRAEALRVFANSQKQGSITKETPDGWVVTPNPDGSVVITGPQQNAS